MPPKRHAAAAAPAPVPAPAVSAAQGPAVAPAAPAAAAATPSAATATTTTTTATKTGAVHENEEEEEKQKQLPMCKYGANCYRKNPEHFKQFRHPSVVPSSLALPKVALADYATGQPPAKKAKKSSQYAGYGGDSSGSEAGKDTDKEDGDEADGGGKKKDGTSGTPTLGRCRSSVAEIIAACAPDASEDEELRHSIEAYKALMRTMLMNKRRISAEQKRALREVRRDSGVPDAVHTALLGKFGWTEDEYEDGERSSADDDVDLDEERRVLANADGFEVIWLQKDGSSSSAGAGTTAAAAKARENVFGRVCMKFFQTMARAQGNFTVRAVGVIANSKLRAKYQELKAQYAALGKDGEQWGFHGTGKAAVKAIAQAGFLAPREIKAHNRKHKKSKIKVLDSGFFGAGIYFSDYSDYAMYYSDSRGSDEILLCKLLPGHAYKCKQRMDGESNKAGYDSHVSPGGNEIVIFNPAACLPRYIIRFSMQAGHEREQES